MLRLDNVAMRYAGGAEVLHQLNLSLARGELVFLMGPTGAARDSLLRLLGLLQMPSEGELSLFGRNVAHLTRDEQSAFRRRIGMVFQDARLLDHLSGYDNVALPLRLHGARDDQIRGFVREMPTWLGFSAALDVKPCGLSLGQRQLIAVARAIIARPQLLLCDEPTSNLDGKRARRLMHLLTQLRKLGTTVVLATHSDDLVERYRHPVLRLNDGYLSGPWPPAGPMVATGVTPSARSGRAQPRSAAGSDHTAAPIRRRRGAEQHPNRISNGDAGISEGHSFGRVRGVDEPAEAPRHPEELPFPHGHNIALPVRLLWITLREAPVQARMRFAIALTWWSTSAIDGCATVAPKAQRHYRYSQGAVPGKLTLSLRFCLLWAAGLFAAVVASSYLIR